MVEQSVDGGAGEQFVLEEGAPFIQGPVGRDDHGAALVTQPEDLVEVERLVVLQGAQ